MDLAEIRKRKGLTQEEMAKSLGITRPAYTNIEARKRKPSGASMVSMQIASP